MARQPFNPTYSGTPIAMAPSMIDEMPRLAQLVGRIAVNWTGVDLQMALLLGSLIGVENEAAVAVFASLRNHRAQRDALSARGRQVSHGRSVEGLQCIALGTWPARQATE